MPQPPHAMILVTGFQPFGGETINPSWEVARALAGSHIAGAEVVACELPCEFGAALAALERALQASRPGLVLALGQAAGRSDFSLERVAINVDDARLPDNAGAQPIDQAVVAGGPAAYFATLPIKAMVAALHAAGLPASVSQTAGTFVCNHVFYGLMHRLVGAAGARAGFMHLPLLPQQAVAQPGLASMPVAVMVEGVRIALAAAWQHSGDDVRLTAGAEA